MTKIYFVRHAQPDETCADDRTRPLTELGLSDREAVAEILMKYPIDCFYSSNYKRSYDTIALCAEKMGIPIQADERFRERKAGRNAHIEGILQRRWGDFNFCEPDGENLRSVQTRNIEALQEVLENNRDKNIVIGTHGTALSTILNYYDKSFNENGFMRLYRWLPFIIRLDFSGDEYIGKEELFYLDRGYNSGFYS